MNKKPNNIAYLKNLIPSWCKFLPPSWPLCSVRSKLRLLQYYAVLWIHVVDAIDLRTSWIQAINLSIFKHSTYIIEKPRISLIRNKTFLTLSHGQKCCWFSISIFVCVLFTVGFLTCVYVEDYAGNWQVDHHFCLFLGFLFAVETL